MEPLTLDSTDVGQIESVVSHIYSKMHIGAVGDSTHAKITRRVLGAEVAFDDLDYSFDIGYAAEPPDLLIICEVIANTIRRDGVGPDDRADDTFGPGDQFLISRPGLPYGGLAHSTRLRFTLLDPAILTRVVATTSTPPDGGAVPVQLLDHRPISRQAQLQLQRCIAYVRDEVMAAHAASPAPLLVSTASHYLAASVLHAYPNTALTAATPQDHRDAHQTTLSRAVAFIEANPDLDLTLVTIARAAYVTPRALQLAFRQQLDTTPMAYLRRVRLDHARDDLRRATTGDGTTITRIATRWGYTSSAFTRQYRAAYGEYPSHTLRQ